MTNTNHVLPNSQHLITVFTWIGNGKQWRKSSVEAKSTNCCQLTELVYVASHPPIFPLYYSNASTLFSIPLKC